MCFYNDREKILKVFPDWKKNTPRDGYLQVKKMRKWSKNQAEFDEYMKKKITLSSEEVEGRESQDIWKNFQPKFMVVSDVAKYSRFNRELLLTGIRECIR
jgi:hypothetical protein